MNEEKRYCPNCGREIDGTWRTCPYCGYELNGIIGRREERRDSTFSGESFSPIPQPIMAPKTQKSKDNVVKIIVGVVVGIILIPLILWYALPIAGVDVATGAISVCYHSVLHNNIVFYIDGEYKGEYPSDEYITFHGISPGTHTIRATTIGGTYLDEKTVQVTAGETVTVDMSYLG